MQKYFIIGMVSFFVMGGIIGATITDAIYIRQLGDADRRIGEYRIAIEDERTRNIELENRIESVEGINRELQESINRTRDAAVSIADSIDEIGRITGTMAEKLRRVIEAIKIIQTKLRDLAMD